MTDIIIYTSPETLLHKQDKLDDDCDKSDTGKYFWEFSRFPKRINKGDKVYFATKGFIRGYFIVWEIGYDGEDTLTFESESWVDIKPIPTKSFQGFKYADKVKELNENKKS